MTGLTDDELSFFKTYIEIVNQKDFKCIDIGDYIQHSKNEVFENLDELQNKLISTMNKVHKEQTKYCNKKIVKFDPAAMSEIDKKVPNIY